MAAITNAERSSATRAALLDATIQAIITYGYQGATSSRIAELSGLTRGAQLHHFKNKETLVVEALLHLHARRMAMFPDAATYTTLEQVIEDIWCSFGDEMWLASMELLTAARTDEVLKATLLPAEAELTDRLRQHLKSYFTSRKKTGIPRDRIDAVVGLTLSAIRGIALHDAFEPNEERSKVERRELVRALLALSGEKPDGRKTTRSGRRS